MSPSEDKDPALVRAGVLLRQRRVDLNLRFRRRTVFEQERAAGINPKMLQDIENGTRGGYSDDNKRAMEKAYGLRTGNIDRLFAGGNLEPLAAAAMSPEEVGAAFLEFLEGLAQKEGRGKRSA